MLRNRRRGQSVVEFGIIAILFTLIMFAIADFGLLLNDWLSVSSGARLLAREASVGVYTCQSAAACPPGYTAELLTDAARVPVPGVTGDPYFNNSPCCYVQGSPGYPNGSALQVSVVYWDECTPSPSGGCSPVAPATLDSRYSSAGVQGGCNLWKNAPPNNVCAHPASPSAPGPCGAYCPGDTVTVTLTAAGAQVITPLVRPFFKNSTTCPQTTPYC
ncbi:MAG: pilus assembly protein, partial [Chloroflexi bacterium]|nr:pilus assembly protein [Chloroflexota bacterium]